jgi:hypothetical protein
VYLPQKLEHFLYPKIMLRLITNSGVENLSGLSHNLNQIQERKHPTAWTAVHRRRSKIDKDRKLRTEQAEPGSRSERRILRTVKQFREENPAFTEGSLRWLLFHRRTNGLDRAVVQVGRRVLIDVDAFFAWIDQQNGRQ